MGEGDAEIIDLTLEKGEFVGKRIGDIKPNEYYDIIAVYENGEVVIPKTDMVLKPGIKISILVKTKYAQDVLKLFTEENIETEIFPGIKVELYQPKK